MPQELDEELINDDLNDPLDESLENNEGDDLNDDPQGDQHQQQNQLTAEQIASIAAQTALRVAPQHQQQSHQWTPEELDAKLNRFKVSHDLVRLLRDPEADPTKIVEQLQALADGAARHAVTSAQLLYQNELTPFQKQLEAQQQYIREQQTSTFCKHAETRYPALAGKGKVIRQALEAVSQSGWTPPNGSKSAALKQVALVAQQIIRSVDPTFSLKSSNPSRQAGSLGARRSSGGGASPARSSGASSFLEHLR